MLRGVDEPRWLDDEQMAAWRPFAAVMQLLPGALDAPLRPHGLSYFEYMVLAMLSDAPDHSLRMSYLAQLTQGSLSRLSHVATRLEQRGWITRGPCAEDRRATIATLTRTGYAKLAAAAPTHVASVHALVFDHLDGAQVRQLRDLAEPLLQGLLPGTPRPWDTAPQRADSGE